MLLRKPSLDAIGVEQIIAFAREWRHQGLIRNEGNEAYWALGALHRIGVVWRRYKRLEQGFGLPCVFASCSVRPVQVVYYYRCKYYHDQTDKENMRGRHTPSKHDKLNAEHTRRHQLPTVDGALTEIPPRENGPKAKASIIEDIYPCMKRFEIQRVPPIIFHMANNSLNQTRNQNKHKQMIKFSV